MKTRRLVYILFCVACLSCQRGRPARKELPPSLSMLPEIGANSTPFPSRWSLNSTQASTGYLFYSTDTSMLTDGIRRDFLVLSIPDPTRDSTIGALISAGQSLAPYLLTELQQLNKAGVVIDLRLGDNASTIREDYLVNSSTWATMVILLSDQSTSNRAGFYSQCLQQFPGISWSIINDRPRYQTDCFKDIHPSF